MPGWLKPAVARQQRGLHEQQQQQQQAAPPLDLSGVYVKDKVASDSLDEACDVMRLGGLVRIAIGLIKGVELRQQDGVFTFVLHSGILWFKVTERYSEDGRPARFKRRDLRRGTHVGHVERCPTTGGILMHVKWGDPMGGHGRDHFYLADKDVLHVDTTLTVGDRTVRYRQVYRKVS
ncbi:hypothetical protein COHA_002593 [Chlorella ohadii]|uniref:Uncharacterized protein n=1 Tax=Chlorella ohadii TaxID=2649997 RepID=A0AAD5H474_9CHLO|nr:hypothetical protein COHA_002593 [Chlorella ohadii]